MVELAGRALYYPIVIVLVGALLVRSNASQGKRTALLVWGALLLALRVSAWVFARLRIPDALFAVPVAAAAALAVALKRFLLPFRLRCARCCEPLGLARMMASDENLCERCVAAGGADHDEPPPPSP